MVIGTRTDSHFSKQRMPTDVKIAVPHFMTKLRINLEKVCFDFNNVVNIGQIYIHEFNFHIKKEIGIQS